MRKNIIISNIIIFFLCSFIPLYAQNMEIQEINELIREYNLLINQNNEETETNNIQILFIMRYNGSQYSADMLFLSNSIMVLRSYFYSLYPQRENRFFTYSLDENILRITFFDPRIDVARHLEVTISHMAGNRDILSVNYIEKSITYNIERNRILFGGFYFYLDN